MPNDCAGRFFELRAKLLESLPTIDPLELAQLRQTGRHRQRIAGQRSRLINRTERRELIHDFRATAERTDRQSAADHFAERGQIRPNAVDFLRTAARDAKAGHHFIEDEKRAVLGAFLAQRFEKILAAENRDRRWPESVRE